MKGLLDRDTVKGLKEGGWKRVILVHLGLCLLLLLLFFVAGRVLGAAGLGQSVCPARIALRAIDLLEQKTAEHPLWAHLPTLPEDHPLRSYSCPFCGMSRAHLAALRLDFSAAFGFHPLFFLGVPYLFLLLHDGLFSKKGKRLKNLLAALLTAAFLICWLLRLLSIV